MLLVRIDNEPRLTEVLHAAQKTDFYKTWLRALDDDLERVFDLLPHVDVQRFHESPERFSNPRHSRLAAEFSYPLSPMPRIAVLASGFKRASNIRVMPKWTPRDLAALKAD